MTNLPHSISPVSERSMIGAGIAHRGKNFITHSTLPQSNSAFITATRIQKIAVASFFSIVSIGLFLSIRDTIIALLAVLNVSYLVNLLADAFLVWRSVNQPPEINVSNKEVAALKNKDLPLYTVLCPLYKEAAVLPQFVDSMKQLNYPKNKLEVLILLEKDDLETQQVATALDLPKYFKIVLVPNSNPKTKPKACNYGLNLTHGKYLVIYDAEDKPERNQLKRAYIAFTLHPDKRVVCLQAKLNYYNPQHNLLTRLFTAEYSLWFDMILPGLQSVNTMIPLGGTSNHFIVEKLRELHGWDAFNVTEDCDLGVRLFRKGYRTAIINSMTLEEANSRPINWLRQRSRWIKGYMQTYLVHVRSFRQMIRDHKWHALVFQLNIGGKIAVMVINPILWATTIAYFGLHRYFGAAIESVFPAPIFYIGVISLLLGNFMYLYNYMIGCAKRGEWWLIKYVFFIPFYWLWMSVAAAMAAVQLVFKPHYWEKTHHGFHLEKKVAMAGAPATAIAAVPVSRGFRLGDLRGLIAKTIANMKNAEFIGASVLVAASLLGSIFNFLYNAYLGRTVSIEAFGLISLIGSFVYIAQVIFSALSRSVTHKSAYLLGHYNSPVKSFWKIVRRKSLMVAIIVSGLWLCLTPVLQLFFHAPSLVPFLLFTPVWFIGTLASVDQGFLSGNLNFTTLAVLAITEAVSKFIFTVLLVQNHLDTLVYAAIPLSMTVSFSIGWFCAYRLKEKAIAPNTKPVSLAFPSKFFFTSILTTLTGITYLSLDLVLAEHYLSPADAGAYSFLSLVGKMVYFLSALFTGFINPFVSRDIGAGKKSSQVFIRLLALTLLVDAGAFLMFGLFGFFTIPLLWGTKTLIITQYVPIYALAMIAFSLSTTIINYHQVRHEHLFPIAGLLLGFVEVAGIVLFHRNIETIASVAFLSSIIMLGATILLDKFYPTVLDLWHNAYDFLGLFGRLFEVKKPAGDKLRILIFNWRDTKHRWAGGAEVYIHELSKRWVKMGHEVTVFCGNDNHCPRFETIDGVHIIRRGGFYTVYLWAFLYYRYRLSGKYDVIIDSENGLPFFTPLYSRRKCFLLIHHVHQEVFRKSLRPPLSWLALILERRIMPMAYKNTEVITVSPSSKADILDHKLTQKEPYVVYNGVDLAVCKPKRKSTRPLVLYLGRLTNLKSIPVLIGAAERILKKLPRVQFVIAGDGPARKKLMRMVQTMGLQKSIIFTGRVSEEQKVSLYQQAWIFVNPSLIEGWGITTIEANACGTPVVASNVQGLRDAVHNPHSGFLVPYGNIEEFEKQISALLRNTKLRKKMSSESIAWAKNYDWDQSAERGIKILLGTHELI
jgi:glycosyltransferase involved in cell wall biosynthesis/cellulose synthase/poly-beta-1,6-N-acetylglucosamine synthase-like glycosyltransferase/O-antigen/teichoic acid export membrane protein